MAWRTPTSRSIRNEWKATNFTWNLNPIIRKIWQDACVSSDGTKTECQVRLLKVWSVEWQADSKNRFARGGVSGVVSEGILRGNGPGCRDDIDQD